MRRLSILVVWMLTWSAAAYAVDPKDLLPPERAFKLSVVLKDASTVRARWDIADGYYMYRERFKFSADTSALQLQPAVFPLGQAKHDEFFGEVHIYRGQAVIDIPIARGVDAPNAFNLTTVSQGCADVGVCYPPQTQTVALTLAAAESGTGSDAPSAVAEFFSGLKNKLGATFGGSDPSNKFLQPDDAYRATFDVQDDGASVIARWDIADGYYMYRDKFAFKLVQGAGVRVGAVQLPPGEAKVDEAMGKTEVYHNQVAIKIPLLRTGTQPTDIALQATYQGCAEAGFCYPPMTKTVQLALPAVQSISAAPAGDGVLSEQDRLARSLTTGNIPLALLTFFGLGLLLAFTPCVFPMIPILSGIIAGQKHTQHTPAGDFIVVEHGQAALVSGRGVARRRAFTLSLVYVLAMALTYTVAGVIAGLFGENLQAASQNPWVLGIFSAVFVLLALSMFGFYHLQIPAAWQGRLAGLSNKQQSGSLTGVAVMGFLSALIVGPCVAAPLAGALIYIGQTGDALLGGLALFALGMGMGAPLLVIGTSIGQWLPKAGPWMDAVKAVFGVLLLALAIWMLERILPAHVTMVLWAVLLIVSAVYMGALDRLAPDVSGWRKLWKGAGFIMVLYGALLLIGAASGGTDVLRPLEGLTARVAGGSVAQTALPFKRIKTIEQLNQEIAAASAQGKPVMLDFYADWCVACKEMEKYTFSDVAVRQALSTVVLLQADVTANDEQDKALLKHLGLIGPPSILFFSSNGVERKNARVVGFMGAEEFLAHVRRALL